MTNLTSSLYCIACGKDDDAARGWRAYIVAEKSSTIVTFCPECAEREMGEDER
jgi:hypothetical protein